MAGYGHGTLKYPIVASCIHCSVIRHWRNGIIVPDWVRFGFGLGSGGRDIRFDTYIDA